MKKDYDTWIEDAVDAFSSGDNDKGNEVLVEFAKVWAKAGLKKESFIEMQNHIIQSAIKNKGEANGYKVKH